jgi:xanthine dehydrogenase large subunit
MDHIAFALKKDPLAVRRLNFYANRPGGPRPRRRARYLAAPGAVQTTPYHMPVEDFIGTSWWPRPGASCDYRRARPRLRLECRQPDPEARDRADAGEVRDFLHADLAQSGGALVHVYQDGSIHLNHGGTEMGQGLNQKVAQVVASVFGVETGQVRITPTDTGKVPNTSATAASSGSDLNGMAAQAAAVTIRDRMAALLAEKHQVRPAEAVRSPTGMVRSGARNIRSNRWPPGPIRRGCRCPRPASTPRPRSPGTGCAAAGGRSSTSPMARR